MASVDEDAAVKFGHLVRRYVDVVDGEAAGVDLLRQLRAALADMYAVALHHPPPPRSDERNIELTPYAKSEAVMATLERRLPGELYWSGLLPRTYADVGDLGVKTLADVVATIYGEVAPGLAVLDRTGVTTELLAWWFEWEYSWGISAARCIAILHELINDLETYARSET